jgi:cytochrome P450
MTYLVEHPEAREMLVAEPTILDNLVEELLRWETPVQSTAPRLAKIDTEVGGCPIKAGTIVTPMVAAANLDPTDPGALTVDLRRGDKRHLAFGGGPHRCLGSHLARMELRVVVREWHKRIPEYRLKAGTEIVWNSSTLRGVDHLELEWDVEGRSA